MPFCLAQRLKSQGTYSILSSSGSCTKKQTLSQHYLGFGPYINHRQWRMQLLMAVTVHQHVALVTH